MASEGGRPIGTHREIADRNVLRFHRALERAKLGGRANIAICKEKLDQWLEYRHQAQQDGTLDEEQRL